MTTPYKMYTYIYTSGIEHMQTHAALVSVIYQSLFQVQQNAALLVLKLLIVVLTTTKQLLIRHAEKNYY